MRKTATTQENSTIGIAPTMPWRVAMVTPLADYCLKVSFLDGTSGEVDLSGLILGNNAGIFQALRDPELFAKVYLEHGVVTWPGEIDLAPDAMYEVIKKYGKWVIK